MAKHLSDFQFGGGGVVVSYGAKVILQNADMILSKRHKDGYLAMLTVDFSNAFKIYIGLDFFMLKQKNCTLRMNMLCHTQ